VLNLDLSLQIISGTGRFRNATGTLTDKAFLNVGLAAPVSGSALTGQICGIDSY
jgi:hypothetical protein